MKKILKRIAVLFLVALVGVSSVACSLDELEQPEWLEQALCDHVFDEEEILKEPTCAEKGKKEEICSDCGKTRITTIRATGEHIYDDEGLTLPTPWNERVTAGGKSVLNGSKAKLHKIVGSTVVIGKDENGLNGTLVNASFGGIKSTGVNGEESELGFPNTELPLYATIDFDTKKITNYGVDIVFTGTEGLSYYQTEVQGVLANSIVFYTPLPYVENKNQNGVCTDANLGDFSKIGNLVLGVNSKAIYWIGILDVLGYTTAGTEPTAEEKGQAGENFKDYLKQRFNAGDPVKIRYLSSVLQSETTFTEGNEYNVWNGGTETVLGNDGAEYGAIATITTDYVFACTVCGKARGEIVPEEEMVECSSHTYLATGHCSTCNAFILDRNINYRETSGELAYGWYRVSEASLPSIELVGDFEVLSAEYEVDITTFKLSNFEFDDSYIYPYIFVSHPSLNLFLGAHVNMVDIPAFLRDGYIYFRYFSDTICSMAVEESNTFITSNATAAFASLSVSAGTVEKVEFVN